MEQDIKRTICAINEVMLKELAGIWVEWNCKEITGNQFASEFRRLFPKYTNSAWRRYLDKSMGC